MEVSEGNQPEEGHSPLIQVHSGLTDRMKQWMKRVTVTIYLE